MYRDIGELMKSYCVKFRGRLSGAIGITYHISEEVYTTSRDIENIRLALHSGKTKNKQKYELISELDIGV